MSYASKSEIYNPFRELQINTKDYGKNLIQIFSFQGFLFLVFKNENITILDETNEFKLV